jgi:hypothetical protein
MASRACERIASGRVALRQSNGSLGFRRIALTGHTVPVRPGTQDWEMAVSFLCEMTDTIADLLVISIDHRLMKNLNCFDIAALSAWRNCRFSKLTALRYADLGSISKQCFISDFNGTFNTMASPRLIKEDYSHQRIVFPLWISIIQRSTSLQATTALYGPRLHFLGIRTSSSVTITVLAKLLSDVYPTSSTIQ